MTEIIEKAGETVSAVSKGSSFLDSVLNKETFEVLDQHAHTLDMVGTLMTKANALLSNPVVTQIVGMASQMKESKSLPNSPVDAWSNPTMSELVGSGAPPPRPAAPIQPIAVQSAQAASMPPQATQEPPQATSEVSALHTQVKAEMDKLSEDQLMDLLMKMSNDPDIADKVAEVKEDETDKP